MTFPTYHTGSVSVSDGGVVVTGLDTRWQRVNVREGDRIIIDPDAGHPEVTILSIGDVTHLTLAQPWTHGDKAAVSYRIIKGSIDRTVGARSFEDIDKALAALNADGFYHFVPPADDGPDESDGYDGQYAYQESTRKKWIKEDGAWRYLGVTDAIFSRYDILMDDPGQPGSGEQLLKWVAPSVVTFRAELAESRARADIAATAAATYALRKNGVAFATMRFAAAANAATFTLAADTPFAAGDVLTIVAPNPRDATLKGVAATIVGYR
jgi:hypothetical protein